MPTAEQPEAPDRANRQARLVAVGGLSGTGKSTLAKALALHLDAVLVRSDVERKTLLGVPETTRLDQSSYSPEMTEYVYRVLVDKCAAVLAMQATVVVDAVFARADERRQMEAVARRAHAPYCGLWLEARTDIRRDRVARRTGDASDATTEIVDRQSRYDVSDVDWHRIVADGRPDATLQEACRILVRSIGRPPTK